VDPIPDPILLRKSGSAGNRTRDLWICSQELWPLDHRGCPFTREFIYYFNHSLIYYPIYLFIFFLILSDPSPKYIEMVSENKHDRILTSSLFHSPFSFEHSLQSASSHFMVQLNMSKVANVWPVLSNLKFHPAIVEVRYWILSHPDFFIISYSCKIHFSIVAPKIVVEWLALLRLIRFIPELDTWSGSSLFSLGFQMTFPVSLGCGPHNFQFIIHILTASAV
jgi:hypothetical protein